MVKISEENNFNLLNNRQKRIKYTYIYDIYLSNSFFF